MRLSGARVLVTGGSSGIGRAVAVELARRGGAVTIVGSDPHRVAEVGGRLWSPEPPRSSGLPEDTPDRLPEQSIPAEAGVVCDFADAAAVSALADRLAGGPAFDLVVHSAGIGLRGPAADLAAPDLDRLLAVNVRAPVLLTGAVLGRMLRRGSGRLAFVGSIAGAVGAAGEAAYAASKAALAGYADSLRAELAGSGVGVTVLLPGVVDTAFFTRRGTPYHRSRPRPIRPERAARALVRAVERDRDLAVAPGWLRVPIALHGLSPQSFGRLAGRFGR